RRHLEVGHIAPAQTALRAERREELGLERVRLEEARVGGGALALLGARPGRERSGQADGGAPELARERQGLDVRHRQAGRKGPALGEPWQVGTPGRVLVRAADRLDARHAARRRDLHAPRIELELTLERECRRRGGERGEGDDERTDGAKAHGEALPRSYE